VNPAGTVAVFSVIPATRPQATATEDLVNTLRDDVLPKEHVTSYVTGTTAGTVDFTERVTSRILWLILTVVAIAFLLLTTAFRSVVIAIKAAILNLLSIGASYGVIVAIFQWGWGKSLIGLQTTLPIPSYVPMLVFAIVFGLSMDYEVFLLSRVHEAWVQTRDPHRAVAIGIGGTARVITTAAAIMVVVFASFVLNTDPTVKMLAIGMAFAVLIDASLVRMLLVPSVMALLGSHAWWMPRWMEPIVPHLQLEGSADAQVAPEPVPASSVRHPAAMADGERPAGVEPDGEGPAGVEPDGEGPAGVEPAANGLPGWSRTAKGLPGWSRTLSGPPGWSRTLLPARTLRGRAADPGADRGGCPVPAASPPRKPALRSSRYIAVGVIVVAVAAHRLPASEPPTARAAVATRTRVADSRVQAEAWPSTVWSFTHGGQTRADPLGRLHHDREQGAEDRNPRAHGPHR
jgi:hypothetical protein